MALLFMFIVYVYIYVCLHYFLTNIFYSCLRKYSLGFSSPIFYIINSLVYSYNKNQFSATAHSVYYVLSFLPHFGRTASGKSKWEKHLADWIIAIGVGLLSSELRDFEAEQVERNIVT
jgi:hypothetical protein